MSDGICLACVICGTSQRSDEGGEVRFLDNRRTYVCSKCLPAWKASELWNTEFNEDSKRSLRTKIEQEAPKPFVEEVSDPRFDLNAREIKERLDDLVVGQDSVKRGLATVAHRHYMRVKLRAEGREDEADSIPRRNVLLVGPTGSGKTLLARSLAEVLNVPHIVPSAAHFTEAGYHGNSVNEVFKMLTSQTAKDGEEAHGIICWDEIDKKAKRSTERRDVSGLGVQQALLDQLDTMGRLIDISDPRSGTPEMFDTSDVLFLMTGAFSDGLEDIIRSRVGRKNRGYGFASGDVAGCNVDASELMRQITLDDIEAYGFIPEFCSRIGRIFVLDPLDEDDMRKILLDVKNAPVPAVCQVAKLMGVGLTFEAEAVDLIAKRAVESGMGARNLGRIVDDVTSTIFYDAPDRRDRRATKPRYVVTAATVDDPDDFEVR